MPPSDLPQPATQLVIGDRPRSRRETLRRPMLTRHATRAAFRDPEAIDEHDDRSSASLRG
jgi:hypothetical protein